MGSISSIVSDLQFARTVLLKSIEGLSKRELTELPIYEKWTIKDVLAHLIGWDQRVIETLPLLLQNRAGEIPSVEVEEHNRASVQAWRDKPLAEVRARLESVHQQILSMISSLDHIEIDMRRERNGRFVTIRSYVIDIMTEHERRHAAEIEQWRSQLEQAIDPGAIKAELAQNRTKFLALLEGLSEAAVLDKTAFGAWSIKDLVGHVVAWEQRILDAAYHIYDPSLPEVPPLDERDDTDTWNEILAAERAACSWAEVWRDLHQTRQATDKFIARLKPGDWRLRGPYPWPADQGTLAELLVNIAEHDADHWPDLEKWRASSHNSG